MLTGTMPQRALICLLFSASDLGLAIESVETLRAIGFDGPVLAQGDGPEASFPREQVARLVAVLGSSPGWNQTRVGYRANARSLARLLARSVALPDWDVLIKMDPDALIFHPDLFAAIDAARAEGAAAIGVFRRNAAGGSRPSPHLARRMLLDLVPGAPCYRVPDGALRPSLARPRYLRHLAAARRNGLAAGEHLLGGLYAVARTAVEDALRLGFCEDCDGPVGLYSGEDLILSVYLAAAGHAFGELHFDARGQPRDGRRAWIQFAPPCRLPAGLDPSRLCAIHPVKAGDPLRAACLAAART